MIYKTDSWKNYNKANDSKLKEELNQLIKKHEDIKNKKKIVGGSLKSGKNCWLIEREVIKIKENYW